MSLKRRNIMRLNPLQNHNKISIQTTLLHTYLYSKHTVFASQNAVNEVLFLSRLIASSSSL